MNKKELLLFGALTSALLAGCQDEKLSILKQLPAPITEINFSNKTENKSSEKTKEKAAKRIACTIDLSDKFIPELLALSRDAQQYFRTDGILQNPFQRERLGIFSSFAHHKEPLEHYAKAIQRRRKNKQPKIDIADTPYPTEKTAGRIYNLEHQIKGNKLPEKQAEKIKQELESLLKQMQEVKKVQQLLQWEGFYNSNSEVNGIYDAKTSTAVINYQKYHQRRLFNNLLNIQSKWYELKANGMVNRATQELLNKDFEEYALGGMRRVLEERVFHAKCGERYPYVIEQKELDKLVDSAAEQLKLNTLESALDFFSSEHSSEHNTAAVYLEIPERYMQRTMKLEVDVEKWDSGKWEKVRTKTNLRLYAIEDSGRIELLQAKAVAGGWVKNKKTGQIKKYKTPEREFYLKHLTVLPHWNPPDWAAAEKISEEEKLPGPFNAFGTLNAPLYFDDKPQKDPFKGWQDGDDGYRIHLTPWPSSVEIGGASHGCIRIHPNMSRFFYFLMGYTPHKIVLERDPNGKETLKFTLNKGSSIPFEPEHYIKVRTCKEKCG